MATLAIAVGVLLGQAAGLSAYLDKDLSKLPDDQRARFEKELSKLVGKPLPEHDSIFGYSAYCVKPYLAGKIHWLCLSVSTPMMIPSVHAICVDAFDSNWRFLRRTQFPTGWRLSINSVKVFYETPIRQPVLEVSLEAQGMWHKDEQGKWVHIMFPDGLIETYAITEKGASLIRLEEGGRLSPGAGWQPSDVGPDVMKRATKEWKSMLDSEDPIGQLECLVWMPAAASIDHADKEIASQVAEEWKAYTELKGDPAVEKRINQLAESPNPWVKRQATFTRNRVYGLPQG